MHFMDRSTSQDPTNRDEIGEPSTLKRPSLCRRNANRPPSALQPACTQITSANALRANARMIRVQFGSHSYLTFGQLVSQRYVASMSQRAIGVVLPDVITALCVSYSFAPHDVKLVQLAEYLSKACKLWTAQRPCITKKLLLTLIARFLMKCNDDSGQLTMDAAERYYDKLIQTKLIVLIKSAVNEQKFGYVAISEEFVSATPSEPRCGSLQYYRLSM